jgi:hypothetical protein
MLSIIMKGHVFNVDFPAKYNNWDNTELTDLFSAEIEKNEANPKARYSSKESGRSFLTPPQVGLTTYQDAHASRINYKLSTTITQQLN